MLGPATLSGEYNQASVDRSGGDADFESWHVQAAYTLTGESVAKAYRVDAGGPIELAARLAKLDVQDGPIAGGEEDAASLALNWYANPNLRLMLNWTHVLDTSGGSATTAAADGLNFYTFRAQFTF